jgi:hypothetical protein
MTDSSSPAPVEQMIEYEARPVDGLAEGSIYAGFPTPESEAAWKSLMEGQYQLNPGVRPAEIVTPVILIFHIRYQHQIVPARDAQTQRDVPENEGRIGVVGSFRRLP